MLNRKSTIWISALASAVLLGACSNAAGVQTGGVNTAYAQSTAAAVQVQESTTAQTQQSTQAAVQTSTAAVQTVQTVPAESGQAGVVNSQNLIGEEQAKSIALQTAGVSADTVSMMWVELDRDYNHIDYEIEFHSGEKEYEISVDAYTGAVLEYSSESIYD